jgi:hypothetical protein
MRTAETVLIIIRGNRRRSLASCLTRKAVTSSSEGRSWKSGAEMRAARWLLTLPHVRFGGGRLEKQVMLLAGRLRAP